MEGCQYIGPEQVSGTYTMCGCKTLWPGKAYCEDHVWLVYQKGTSKGNKRKLKEIENELADIKRLQEIAEIEDA
jgi:hypothetical protein